jgi:transcriptional regulator with XRE-family HTH domain
MSETEGSSIGRRLRAARDHVAWSREALAFHSGLSWSAIAQIEAGRRTNVRPATLSFLADALGVTVDYLLGRDGGSATMIEHAALIYATEDEFIEHAARFVGEGVERSEATLVVTTLPRIKRLRRRLGAAAGDATFAEARRWYSTPPAALSAYRKFVEEELAAGAGWIRILGEPVWSGRSASEAALWTRYESLLNLEFAGAPVTIVCPYDASSVDAEILEQAHATHQHTRTDGELAANAGYRPPSDFVLEF